MINGKMVSDGHAWVYGRFCRAAMCREWYRDQKKAIADKIGLWAEDN